MKIQYIGACVTVLTEIYLYTWPADYLMDMVNYILFSVEVNFESLLMCHNS